MQCMCSLTTLVSLCLCLFLSASFSVFFLPFFLVQTLFLYIGNTYSHLSFSHYLSPSLPLSHTLLHLNIFVIGVLSAFFRLDRTKQPQSCKSKQGNLNSVAARQNMPSKRLVNSANYETTLSFLLLLLLLLLHG